MPFTGLQILWVKCLILDKAHPYVEFKDVVKCIFECFVEVFLLCNSNLFCINGIERGVNVES